MSNVIISVSATSDVSQEVQTKYNIAVAPMEFSVGDKTFSTLDGVDLPRFYKSMLEGEITKTSQVNIEEARIHLESLLASGADVLHITISSHLSGTYGNFMVAAKELNDKYPNKVRVVDSLSASCAITLMAVACAKKAQQGLSLDELATYAESLKNNTSALFTVDSLTYLARSGRVSKGAALLGNAINLKVAMRVNDEGALVPYKKVLSRRRALGEIISSTKKMYAPHFDEIFIAYADCKEDAEFVANELKNALNLSVSLFYLGPVIGCHSGPGTLAVFFTSDGKEIK